MMKPLTILTVLLFLSEVCSAQTYQPTPEEAFGAYTTASGEYENVRMEWYDTALPMWSEVIELITGAIVNDPDVTDDAQADLAMLASEKNEVLTKVDILDSVANAADNAQEIALESGKPEDAYILYSFCIHTYAPMCAEVLDAVYAFEDLLLAASDIWSGQEA